MEDPKNVRPYKRVRYSAVEKNINDLSKVDFKVIKQFLTVVLIAFVIVIAFLLCLILGVYFLNLLGVNKKLFSTEDDIVKNWPEKSTTAAQTRLPIDTTTTTITSVPSAPSTVLSMSTTSTPIPKVVLTNTTKTIQITQTTVSTSAPTSAPISVPTTTSTTIPSTDQTLNKYSISFKVPKFAQTEIVSGIEQKSQFIREMMLDSWSAYERYAWGHEALRPLSKTFFSKEFGKNSGLTLVTSMSTLWVMGLKDEFERGKKWIETELDLSKLDRNVPVFETITHYVGGLLSCYSLTGDNLFIEKANDLGKLLKPAFNSPRGIPSEAINLKANRGTMFGGHLSHATGFQIDFDFLSDISRNTKYRDQILQILKTLKEIEKHKNLYPNNLVLLPTNSNIDGIYIGNEFDLFTNNREFYISLVKSFIQSNLKNVQSIEMYKEALNALEAVNIFNVSSTGLYYAQRYIKNSHTHNNIMEYSGCYLGAMLSLGADSIQRAFGSNQTEQNRIKHHLKLAQEITETCHLASKETESKLGPSSFTFVNTFLRTFSIRSRKFYNNSQKKKTSAINKIFDLSPELAESYFILWRLTHDNKYRDYAWEMAQAIHQHCRVKNGGYSGIFNVNQVPTVMNDHQPPHFLSATLKYLYLTFSDHNLLPLDQWAFNAQGHPLPICGKNVAYPEERCKF